MSKSYSDVEHLQLVAQRIAQSGIDITTDYGDWMTVTFACASLGEEAREAYHTICSQYADYRREECDLKFDNCIRTGRRDVRIASLMKLAKDAGIDVSLPRGRRHHTEEEKAEGHKQYMELMSEKLHEMAEYRFDTWQQRVCIREFGGSKWRPFTDRDLDTLYCNLRCQGVKATQQDMRALINSRNFCQDYDAAHMAGKPSAVES